MTEKEPTSLSACRIRLTPTKCDLSVQRKSVQNILAPLSVIVQEHTHCLPLQLSNHYPLFPC